MGRLICVFSVNLSLVTVCLVVLTNVFMKFTLLSSGMAYSVVLHMDMRVSKELAASICTGDKDSKLLCNIGTIYKNTQPHIPEDSPTAIFGNKMMV
jgi:hypothetical protein